MKNTSDIWPVPKSYNRKLPKTGESGSFWENRGDRFHCGIDFYAPKGSKVISVTDGKIINVGVFTSSEKVSYWNKTFYIDVKTDDCFVFRYAELEETNLKKQQKIKKHDIIGLVGQVLNLNKICDSSPEYIKKLKNNKKCSMLHFEVYENKSLFQEKEYLGGNWFGEKKPGFLIDPVMFF